jgi:NOL1/NOP2/fmu family ribosome biogenesis protein
LIANEIHPQRAKILAENLERCGVVNAVVTNETPERLMERFPAFFDRILVDAPCSGEGMFRKLPEAIEDWSPDKVAHCHLLQAGILDAAAHMLKPGGTLVYSTCTFAPLENEQSIAAFLARHREFSLVPLPHPEWFAPGRPEWADSPADELRLTARLWPHLLKGEGHFLAKLQKSADSPDAGADTSRPKEKRQAKSRPSTPSWRREAIAAWRSFADANTPGLAARFPDESSFLLFGDQLSYSPVPETWDGIKLLRVGLHLGTVKKNRLEPSHALALALCPEDAVHTAEFAADDPDVIRYLRGESLPIDGEPGWTLITVDGYSLGWAKQADGQLKNHYPKGLRWL